MQNFVAITQIVISLAIVVLVLLQRRGAGLSGVFGGEGGSWQERRGLEKIIFWLTIFFVVLFVASSLVSLVLVNR